MKSQFFDYILVGGGLQSGLLVLALRHHQPTARVLLVERNHQLAGNHTWSFHPKDVSPSSAAWVSPAVEYRWPSYQVRLNGFQTQVDLSYESISAAFFAEVVKNSLVCSDAGGTNLTEPLGVLLLDTDVYQVDRGEIKTASGDSYRGRLVIDCRGPKPAREKCFTQCGYQKFWGFEIELQSEWPFVGPVVMDDRIDQSDGFRFIYSLPFDRRRVLVEDTRFSNSSVIDRDDCLAQVSKYLEIIGVQNWSIIREEHGILPMPISGERMPGHGTESGTEQVLAGGYAGGWFHVATGYSFPLSIAFAETVACVSPESAVSAVHRLANSQRTRSRFGRFLNRLLFCLVKPTKRYQIFRRFYKVLSADSIARFYSHRFTMGDAFRIVVGMPPAGLQPVGFLRSFFPQPKPAQTSPSHPKHVLKSSYEEISV